MIQRLHVMKLNNHKMKTRTRKLSRTSKLIPEIWERWEICSKLTIKTPESHQLRRSGVFIVNFENISHLVLVFLLLTLNM